jgi:hypothetical protein
MTKQYTDFFAIDLIDFFINMMIKLIISIDTECDKEKDWKVIQPMSFRNIHDGVTNFLQPLFEQYSIKPTYLLSPEVIQDKKSADYFRSLSKNIELGTHLHSEFIRPAADFQSINTNIFQFQLDSEIEYQKLLNLTELFTETFGYKPASFRAGRFGLSNHTLGFLEKLGYSVDSSVTPDIWWMKTEKLGVNFLGSPYQPYYANAKDFRKPGRMNLLEVPITTMNIAIIKWPVWLKLAFNPKIRSQRIVLTRVIQPTKNFKWFRPTFSSADEMMGIMQNRNYFTKRSEKDQRNQSITLCMMFHSNEFTLGTSPYSMTINELDVLKKRLHQFLSLINNKAFRSCTLSELSKI